MPFFPKTVGWRENGLRRLGVGLNLWLGEVSSESLAFPLNNGKSICFCRWLLNEEVHEGPAALGLQVKVSLFPALLCHHCLPSVTRHFQISILGVQQKSPRTWVHASICVSYFLICLRPIFPGEWSVFMSSTPASPLACFLSILVSCLPLLPKVTDSFPLAAPSIALLSSHPLAPLPPQVLSGNCLSALWLSLLWLPSFPVGSTPFGWPVWLSGDLCLCPHTLLQTSRFPVSGVDCMFPQNVAKVCGILALSVVILWWDDVVFLVSPLWFLNLGSTNVFNCIIVGGRGRTMHCRMAGSIPGLHPVDANGTLPVVTIKTDSRRCPCSLQSGITPELRTTDIKQGQRVSQPLMPVCLEELKGENGIIMFRNLLRKYLFWHVWKWKFLSLLEWSGGCVFYLKKDIEEPLQALQRLCGPGTCDTFLFLL